MTNYKHCNYSQNWDLYMVIINHYRYMVGGFKHFLFSIIYGIILPIDFHIFQDGENHQPDIVR